MPKKIKIPVFIRKKYFWQSSMAILAILFIIFFIRNERFELGQIKETISRVNPYYLGLGLLVFLVYLILQALLYVWSFRTLKQNLPFRDAMSLFLKRNLMGVFVPGGTISSLAFFNKDLDKHKLTKTQQYLGSYIFAFASTVSIIIVAIPAFLLLFVKNELNTIEVIGFILIALVIALFGFLLYSLLNQKKGWGYRLAKKYKPDWLMLLDEIAQQSVSRAKLIQTFLISVGIEITGVLHLYIAMLALNASPSIEVAFTGYVIMIILMSVSPFLKGLGAIELSLTFLLVQYGYVSSLAASIILLFRFFEFWLPLFAGILIFIFRKEGLLARILPAIILIILGITNIVSALTPAIPDRLAFIQEWLPKQISELSNFTVLIFGLALIIISIYLFLGSKNAWRMALFLTAFSMIGHIVKAVDYEEAMLALVAFGSLIITRKSYSLKSHFDLTRKSLWNITIPILFFTVYAVTGFYFLNKIHFKKEFDFIGSLNSFIQTLFVYDNNDLLPYTRFGREFLFSVRLLGSSVFIYVLWYIFRPGRFLDSSDKDERNIAIELVAKYGRSRMDYFKTYFDKIFFFNENQTAFLAYRVSENYAVVLENPVAPDVAEEVELIRKFNLYCDESGLIVVYYRVPEDSLENYRNLSFSAVLIGQEAIVDLNTFSLQGKAKHPMRNAINKIKNAGFSIRVYEPPLKEGLLQKLKLVSNEWLAEHHSKEIVFTQGLFDEKELKATTVLTVENADEKVIAFLNLIKDPMNKEGTLDLMRKTPEAPNGVMDFIFVKMFEYFKEQGYQRVNLGLAPLAGFKKGNTLRERATYYVVEYLKKNSRFMGLHSYKEKFDPQWSDRYLVYKNTSDLLKLPMILSKISKL